VHERQLLDAAKAGDLATVTASLAVGASINCVNEASEFLYSIGLFFLSIYLFVQTRWSPLHCAAYSGHVDVCRLLVKWGADVMALSNVRFHTFLFCFDCVSYCCAISSQGGPPWF
jgi:ankyrin repeat protein